jgi:hypothetical protein
METIDALVKAVLSANLANEKIVKENLARVTKRAEAVLKS